MLTDIKVEETGEAVINSHEAKKILASHRMGIFKIRALFYCFVYKQKGYTITLMNSRKLLRAFNLNRKSNWKPPNSINDT
jgi:hypothetical protein